MDNKKNVASKQSWRVAKAFSSRILALDENRVWSPACVTNLLAVAREGSSGTTRQELDALLGNEDFLEDHDPFGIEREQRWGYSDYDASSATAAWLSKSATPSNEFLRRCSECGVHVSVDNLSDPRVGQEVTDWISQQTRCLLAPTIELSPVALACLVSALYLKDAWSDPFENYLTKVRAFHAKGGDIQAAFMRGERRCVVIDKRGCVAFLVPLSSGANMLFALPNGKGNQMDRALDLFEQLSQGKGRWELVDLSIPRFKCETTISDFCSLLEAVGVSTAVTMELVPMVGAKSEPTQVVHGAKLTVNEDGVEAGAYTMMEICAGLPPKKPPRPRKITLDRPFYVAVVSETGAPLFMASVALPSEDTIVWREVKIDSDSKVWRNEEIEGWCQVTVELDPELNVQKITCTINGSMVHTIIVNSYREADEKYEAIKRELEEYVKHHGEDGFAPSSWIDGFVERW